ncbi:amino acid deaminase/aldolase, partial [Rhodococcus pyridinivorans]|nr:amino acid deaminase/aldolase [Rhodococcus pyridinivorans]
MLRAASVHDAALDRVHAATADLDPPFAAVDLPTLRRNADDLIRRANGVPVRVAS